MRIDLDYNINNMETSVNNKCKAFTSLEQSKKLAEILPLESADMVYTITNGYHTPWIRIERIDELDKDDFLCWSLAALLEEIPDTITNIVGEDLKLHIDKDELKYSLFYENEYTGDMFEIKTELYDDMIDACYDMIIRLSKNELI